MTAGQSSRGVSELRAVEFLFTAYDTPPLGMAVLVDRLPALNYLHRWQGGEITAMPAGYDLSPRHAGLKPTLVRLAELVARRPDLMFAHVRAHARHALNGAADSLAHMAHPGRGAVRCTPPGGRPGRGVPAPLARCADGLTADL
ncbi:hypothetical protein [Micromonospora sp. IBHARD004]|uniref:hypothetical protein n=1 Tax=Micromonospora sp. IBHARD004 TaxID=3457764 RepID=UPI004057D85B